MTAAASSGTVLPPAVMQSTGCVQKKDLHPFRVHTGREVIHIQNVTAGVRSGTGGRAKPGTITAILP